MRFSLDDYASKTGKEIRSLCRSGLMNRPTTGVALGYTQVNVVILPAEYAEPFERFCRLNPKPCPLLEMTKPGDTEPHGSAPGADLRTDLPRYRVFRNGACTDRPTTIVPIWQEDFVAFLIGCSFTFEGALLNAGLPVRHLEEHRNVPMYRTQKSCNSSGPFAGPLVVSMRPMLPSQAEEAVRITSEFPKVHGAPVHIGDPNALGIADLNRPDYGDAVTIREGEIPVFWACGVTPLEAILRAKPSLAITHEPGHMLVTDIKDESLREPR